MVPPPSSTQPKRHAISAMPMRVLTSSNSFDLKSNPAALCRFHMSAEAAKLFETLQESPLPLPNEQALVNDETILRTTAINTTYQKTPDEKQKWLDTSSAMKERNHHYG